ncbi:5'-nucleotidase SurE [Luteitalea sp. TBR-22]|uniref:5'/3'-nucleotidase SurE n=1 Tax=Luteitalea sp. TBR-22 TaxID=2802971 RepID=UPI001AF9F696|nr:5'/3'-nucleotidase SurE [Luteitalea sp. TBR-22]BCS33568.1 5'-nucleotidase SurE [Luteitalea sp. TBR-22]
MPTILVTNDDGIDSEGLQALADAVRPLGHVIVCAPLGEASAIGHALTLARPLRLVQRGEARFAVDGTPADCVNVAVAHVLHGVLPDLVISGINKGWNVGDDVTYSGTIGGALEGLLMGVPAIAVSMQRGPTYDFSHAAAAAGRVAREVLAHGLPPRVLLNVNVPQGVPTGWQATTQAARTHTTSVLRRDDPWGRPYYWLDEGRVEWAPGEGTDFKAVTAGRISVTPLHADLTAHGAVGMTTALVARAAGLTPDS